MSNKSKLELKDSSTKKPGGVSGDKFSVILDPNNLISRPLAETTTRSTINIDGFNIGNPLGFTSTTTSTTPTTSITTSTRKAVVPGDSSWSWTDPDKQEEESLEKSPGLPQSIDLSNLIIVNADRTDPPRSTVTTPETTTTESLSDWYQDFFSNLLAANEKKNPRKSTTTTTTTVATPEVEVEDQQEDQHDHHEHHEHHDEDHFQQLASVKKSIPAAPEGNLGLSITDSGLDSAARQFVQRNNQVGFDLYRKLLEQSQDDNLLFSPLSATSSLSMIFLGARGPTSWQINELLELDKIVTVNPHLLYKNISDNLSATSDSSASKDILVSKVGEL